MSKHTPGPWCAGTSLINGVEMFTVCEEANKQKVISVTGKCGADDEQESIANAVFITSAPDLLALHRKHLDLMIEIAQELKNPRMPLQTCVAASIRMLAEAAKESIDAIAKTEGKS